MLISKVDQIFMNMNWHEIGQVGFALPISCRV